jgi:hypothetical protein
LNEDQPRAWIVHEVAVKADREAIYAALAARDFDPRRVAYTPQPIEAVANQTLEPVSIAASQPAGLVLEASLTTPGLLVLARSLPGWLYCERIANIGVKWTDCCAVWPCQAVSVSRCCFAGVTDRAASARR